MTASLQFAAKKLKRRLVEDVIPNVPVAVFFFGGLVAITIGAWRIYQPAGLIVGGVLAVWVGFLTNPSEPR